MPSLPRRLRNLNLAAELFVENCQQGEDSLQRASAEDSRNDRTHQESFHGQAADDFQNDDQLEEENPQGPPELDIALADIGMGVKRSIKIIWANGAVREVFKCPRTLDLWKLNGGRVLVETDENGIPNQWSESILAKYLAELAQSASYAPLHFKRWDDKLLKGSKKKIIIDVEEKFAYSSETKLNTRDWILKTVNKKWRDYKSDLKKKYFHPNKKTLVQMENVVPDGVNENQWSILLGIWSSEGHKKLCQKNAEAAKKLMHPHTTGRKSHPRLKKEMEDKNKGSVSRIDLWDETHKKRNGDYVNDNVQRLMEKAYDELANRRMKNGSLSSKDHDDVFENVIRKELKVNEYYDDQYWSQESDSRAQSEQEKRYERELEIYKFRFNNLCAFIEGKYPGEDWRSSVPAGHTIVSDGVGIGANLDEHANSARFNITIPSPTEYVEIHDESNMNGERNSIDDYKSNESNVVQKGCANKFTKAAKDCSIGPSKSDKETMKTRNGVMKQDKAQQMKRVLLYSTNSRKNKQVVAIGNLISRDKTYVVGGSMLGDGYYCVVVHRLTDAAQDKILSQPYENIQMLEDAMGYCIAWPCVHLKRVRHNPKKHAKKDD